MISMSHRQTVDIDVLVIAIALHFQTGLKELWVELGTGHYKKKTVSYPPNLYKTGIH